MERDSKLMDDVLAEISPGEPAASELIAYARDAAAMSDADRERVERFLAASPAHRDRFRALAPDDWTLAGSCLCGAVRYTVRGPLAGIGHCHCMRCRKAHSAAFGTFAVVPTDAFAWQHGAVHLRRFGGSSDSALSFCSRCGTTLTGTAPSGLVAVTVATLDVDPVARPTLHASVATRAPWYEVTDDVPQIPGPFHTATHEEPEQRDREEEETR